MLEGKGRWVPKVNQAGCCGHHIEGSAHKLPTHSFSAQEDEQGAKQTPPPPKLGCEDQHE